MRRPTHVHSQRQLSGSRGHSREVGPNYQRCVWPGYTPIAHHRCSKLGLRSVSKHLAAPVELFFYCQPPTPNVIKPYGSPSIVWHVVPVRCQLLGDRTAFCAKNYLKSPEQLILRHGKEFFIRHLN